jgi:hypothetical protein
VQVERADFANQARDIATEDGARYAVHIGLALSALKQPALDVNLTPRVLRDKREREASRKSLLGAATLGLVVVALALTVARSNLTDRQKYIDFLDAQIGKLRPPADLVREKKARVDAISSQLGKENSALEVLWKIYELAPNGLVLSELDFIRGQELLIRGMCFDRQIALEFASSLRNSAVEALAKAELGDTEMERVQNVDVIRFEITALMPGATGIGLAEDTSLEEL